MANYQQTKPVYDGMKTAKDKGAYSILDPVTEQRARGKERGAEL